MTQRRTTYPQGMTLLEIMIVLAIMGGLLVFAKGAFNALNKTDLVDDSNQVTAVLKRTHSLSIEHGELHRVVFDLDKNGYVVETCQGAAAIARNELVNTDPEKKKEAIEQGKNRMANMPADAFAAGDPEEATRRATALAGHHIADRECVAVTDYYSGDSSGLGFARLLKSGKGIKFKQIFVQHLDQPVTKGQVAIYFFANGSAEKAVIEVTDGDEVFSVLVYGLTGRVELRDGVLKSIDDHMLKNVLGDKDAARETDK